MEVSAIREARRAVPFRPFRLHLADGRVMTVGEPEWVMVSPTGRQVVAFRADSSMSILEPSQIVSLEFAAPEVTDGQA